MIQANKPANEKERLSFLRHMNILDTPLEERFERITRIVCRSLRVPIAAISLIDEERQWFKSAQGLNVEQTGRAESFCAHTILESDVFVVPNALDDIRFADNPLVTGQPNIRFYAGIPLEVQDGIRIGSLCAIDNEPREMNEEQLEILKDLSEMVKSELAAVKLTSAHMELIADLKSVERAALIDPLTRLWNRRSAEKLLERELHAAVCNGTELSLALVDIDHFKQVNDQHGHDVGDAVLKSFSRVLLAEMRRSDSVCRWGGEEFLLILPECKQEGVQSLLERVMQAIRSNEEPLAITASIGVVCLRPDEHTPLTPALKLADEALYSAKKAGRNRYVIATDPALV